LIKDTSLEQEANPLVTQEYTCSLLRDAIARNAFIVVYRKPKYWIEKVPELAR
jgi:hypothetical protein